MITILQMRKLRLREMKGLSPHRPPLCPRSISCRLQAFMSISRASAPPSQAPTLTTTLPFFPSEILDFKQLQGGVASECPGLGTL